MNNVALVLRDSTYGKPVGSDGVFQCRENRIVLWGTFKQTLRNLLAQNERSEYDSSAAAASASSARTRTCTHCAYHPVVPSSFLLLCFAAFLLVCVLFQGLNVLCIVPTISWTWRWRRIVVVTEAHVGSIRTREVGVSHSVLMNR